jgi:hypothetical protein
MIIPDIKLDYCEDEKCDCIHVAIIWDKLNCSMYFDFYKN